MNELANLRGCDETELPQVSTASTRDPSRLSTLTCTLTPPRSSRTSSLSTTSKGRSAIMERAARARQASTRRPPHFLLDYCSEISNNGDAFFAGNGELQTARCRELRNATRRLLQAKHDTKESLDLTAQVAYCKVASPKKASPNVGAHRRDSGTWPHQATENALPPIFAPSQEVAAAALGLHRSPRRRSAP